MKLTITTVQNCYCDPPSTHNIVMPPEHTISYPLLVHCLLSDTFIQTHEKDISILSNQIQT